MYVTLLLLSLVVFGSCHHGDNDDHLHDELDEMRTKLDRLTAKLQNAADTLNKRKENHDEADRKSRNMLIRLDRLRLNDGTDHCPEKYFKCATVTQCVANILVCDKVPDCADKSDEDENLCTASLKAGAEYYFPKPRYETCRSVTQSEEANVVVDSVEPVANLPSVLKVGSTYTSRTRETSMVLVQAGYYTHAARTYTILDEIPGLGFVLVTWQFLNDNYVDCSVRSAVTDDVCYRNVAWKV